MGFAQNKEERGFRPLRGLRISQSELADIFHGCREGFRPLRGLRISQWCEDLKVKIIHGFPSPAGSSYFSIREHFDIPVVPTGFPSPAGSSYFSIPEEFRKSYRFHNVSVPCGVFVFLNRNLEH